MKILKRILIFFCALIILGYLGLYLVLPYFLNKKDYSKTVTDIIKKETGLVILVHNYKLDVSPALNINFKADVIQGFYPDNKQFLNIKKSDITISTLYLLKKEIKLNKAKAEELQFSTKLLKNGKTTIQEYIEANVKQSPSGYIVSKNHPVIYIKSYIIKLKDEESGQKFKLKGNDLKARRSVDFQNINIETNGDLYCFDKKYLHYNAKVSVPQVLLENTDKMLFDFTVDDLYRYDFSANVTTDLKIHAKDKKIDYEKLNLKCVKYVLIYGEIKKHFQKGDKYLLFKNLNEAFKKAISIKLENKIVFFSPATSSFDQYNNYQERGIEFDNLIKNFEEKSND